MFGSRLYIIKSIQKKYFDELVAKKVMELEIPSKFKDPIAQHLERVAGFSISFSLLILL
jgi:hypothetical protein